MCAVEGKQQRPLAAVQGPITLKLMVELNFSGNK